MNSNYPYMSTTGIYSLIEQLLSRYNGAIFSLSKNDHSYSDVYNPCVYSLEVRFADNSGPRRMVIDLCKYIEHQEMREDVINRNQHIKDAYEQLELMIRLASEETNNETDL